MADHNKENRPKNFPFLLAADIDDTITGNEDAVIRLRHFLSANTDNLLFGVATGRNINTADALFKILDLPYPDFLITSVGTEIFNKNGKMNDQWSEYIDSEWKPDSIYTLLSALDGVELQKNPESQRRFKISYNLTDKNDHRIIMDLVNRRIKENNIRCSVIYSHGRYLDILPYRASKGKAVRYLADKWKIPVSRVITAGNSGNDYDMLAGEFNGIVVANHETELEKLKDSENIYFAEKSHADGIVEGLAYFLKQQSDFSCL